MGRRDYDDDDDDFDDDRPAPRRRIKKKRSGDNTLLYVLLGVGGALMLCLCCGGVGTVVVITSKDKGGNPIARNGVVLDQAGVLTANDPPDPTVGGNRMRMKVFNVHMVPEKTYTINMTSNDFDAYLRLESPTRQRLAEDDDSGGGLNSRIIFRPTQAGPHRVIATSWNGGLGRFHIKVEER
ncbi:MAG TPA: hypothetical protein VFE62_16555 [Gemmataceae bacterium]|nr:hypothetical protein [Gemmataceae bacterium]